MQKSIFEPSQETSLFRKFGEIHDTLYAHEGLSAQQALDEMLKLLFMKVHNENKAGEAFRIDEAEFQACKKGNLPASFGQRIETFWQEIRTEFADIFEPHERINLSPYSLAFAVNKLQNMDFSDTSDAKGVAFQKFLASTEKSDRGQFFTPEPVIDFCVRFINPQPHERIIDPTCGSAGFLFSAYQHLLQKNAGKAEIVQNLYGLDISKTAIRIAKMKFLLETNKPLNIVCENALEDLDSLRLVFPAPCESFDVVLANPPFGGKLNNEMQLKRFDLGYKWQNVEGAFYKTKNLQLGQAMDILFVERCLQLLKNGGRMAIVLPNGTFENPSLEYLRCFIKQNAYILAVINLPQETFIPFGTGVKTSILFLEKKQLIETEKERLVFFGRVTKLGYQGNKNALPTYQKDAFGNVLKGENNEPLLDEDFSQIVQDYKEAQNLPAWETENSFIFPHNELNGRFDFDYYAPKNRKLLRKLQQSKAVPLSEICEIVRAKSPKLACPNEQVEYVELSDINALSYEIINSQPYFVHELPSRASYELMENDIITAVAGNSIGTPKHATALVTSDFVGNICTNGFRVLRHVQLDLYYLLYYLRSEMFLHQVYMYRTGAAIPNISDADVGKILVYLPTETEIQNISEKIQLAFKLRRQARQAVESIPVFW